MHEAALSQGLIAILLAEASRHQVGAIRRVTLKVGQLKAVEPQALAFCFEQFCQGTIAEGAELVIDAVGARARCHACGNDFAVIKFRFQCTRCDSRDVGLITGEELYIESFDA